jgi:orotidine-5'-phosphate decarboxylase
MERTRLVQLIRERRSFLCVGLDPELEKLPSSIAPNPEGVLQFNRAIVDATRDCCVAYKPNLAFYEAMGVEGWQVFQETVRYIGQDHFVIADAKRGDIGNTSRLYAKAFFEQMNCDAITVAPYMGGDSVQPFLSFEGRWAIVLALTSNSGSADFQVHELGGQGPLYEAVLTQVSTWGSPDELMFVVGATHPAAFARVRALVPDHFLLVPGVGAQGGDLAALCAHGLNSDIGLLVNSSRGIIFAGSNTDFAEKARGAAQQLQQEMEKIMLKSGII